MGETGETGNWSSDTGRQGRTLYGSPTRPLLLITFINKEYNLASVILGWRQ